MNPEKRKLDDDEEWTENKKRGKNKKKDPLVKDPTEFMSPFRKPLAQSSFTSMTMNSSNSESGEGKSFHVKQNVYNLNFGKSSL